MLTTARPAAGRSSGAKWVAARSTWTMTSFSYSGSFERGHLPENIEKRFARYVQPIVETYHELGIDAYYRPINDIHVDGKKIGGTGAAALGRAEVVVGSFMFDFDKVAMSKVLKIASEKMRDKVFESLQQYMTTMAEQLGSQPDRETVKRIYLQKVAALLGTEVVAGAWSETEEARRKRDRRPFPV